MTWLLGDLLPYVIGLLGVIAAAFGLKRAGKKEAENDALKDTQKRVEKGRDRLRDNRGDEPADRLSRNDSKW